MIIHLKVHVGNLMVIHDQEKINISFCTYSKRLKKYIYVICIFCKLEKKIFGERSPIYYSWYLNFLSVKKGIGPESCSEPRMVFSKAWNWYWTTGDWDLYSIIYEDWDFLLLVYFFLFTFLRLSGDLSFHL